MPYKLPEISPKERLRIIQHGLYEEIAASADRLKVSKSTIYRWLDRGEVAELRIAKKRFVLTESIDAKFASHIMLPDDGSIPNHLRGEERRFALRGICEAEMKSEQVAA